MVVSVKIITKAHKERAKPANPRIYLDTVFFPAFMFSALTHVV